MAIFPVQFFTQENVRVRLREDYKSRPLVEKSIGHPRGVYLGYIPTAQPTQVTLDPDPTRGVSVLKVMSGVDPGGMDITYTTPLVLDFSSAVPSDLPAFIVATADYDRTGTTSAQIVARTILITTGELLHTVGIAPELVDLSTLFLANTPIRPSTLTINVVNSISGPTTITDDGRGNLIGANGLSSPGTVNYRTGALTGTTAPLAAASTITADYEEGILPTEVLICIVDGPPGALSVRDAEPHERTTPIARASVPYGYMPAGSVETLTQIINIVNEVIAARVDLANTSWASLSERLAEDAGPTAMASRLSPVLRILRSNDHTGVSGSDTVSVGGSLSEINRTHLPRLTLPGGGSETQLGAVTVAPRNACVVIDTSTKSRLLDPVTRTLVYGRLEGPDTVQLNGTLTFTQANDNVTGAGTSFISAVKAGDLLVAPDGLLYEVESVLTDISLILTDSYTGTTTASVGPNRQRYELHLVRWDADSSSEEDFNLPTTTGLRFFFPAFVDHSVSAFDSALLMHAPGEKLPLPSATETIAGHVRLAGPGGLLGSVDVQENGALVGKFRSIDFSGAAGNISETADGVITIGQIGPQGPTGPTGPIGGTGPTGVQGESFNAFNLNQFDTEVDLFAPVGGATQSHSVDMGHEVRAAYGWFARVRCQPGTGFDDGDEVEITDISATGQIATVECSVTAPTRVRLTLYLSSAGIA